MNEATQTVTAVENLTGKRVLAGIIDVVLLGGLYVAMSVAFGEAESETSDSSFSFRVNLTGGAFLTYLLCVFLYHSVLELLTGASIGKLVAGLRVVSESGDGPGLRAVVLRNVVRFVDFLPVFYLLGFIVIATSRKHQRLGDMAAGTVVVRG